MKLLIFKGNKVVGLLSVLLVGSSLLSGCADIMHQFEFQQKQSTVTQACTNAPVLITNLTQDTHHRQYQLENGYQCPKVN